MTQSGGEIGKWKHKYFEALEDLENKEAEWQQADGSLRRGLSRLALAATGVDDALDIQLKKLRRLIQDNASSGQVDLVIEKISANLKRLDEKAQQAAADKLPTRPADVLLHLLGAIDFPKAVRKELKQLKRQLADAQADQNLTASIEAFGRLVQVAFQPDAKSAAENKGWWNKMFSGSGQASAESSETPDQQAESQADSQIEHEPSRSAAEFTPAAAEDDELTPHILAKVFSDFLEQLLFPPQFGERLAALKNELKPGLPLDNVAAMAKTVVGLVLEVRLSLEQEKEELENFLQQLGVRLQELDSMVAGAETTRQESLQSAHELDDMVAAQVNDIEQTVLSEDDLGQMKGSIQGSLEHIRQHLAEKRREDDQRQATMEFQLKQLTERMSEMEDESERLRARLAKERESAMTDALTEIPNRLAYDKQVEKEYTRWQRYQRPLCMLICDVDHFKKLNDSYGHKAGDRALVAIAQTIQYNVRASDFLARIGGEEFVVLLAETDLDGAKAVAEKIRYGIELLEFVYQGTSVPITISGGIAEFSGDDRVDDVYLRADKALYLAKKEGRNRFC